MNTTKPILFYLHIAISTILLVSISCSESQPKSIVSNLDTVASDKKYLEIELKKNDLQKMGLKGNVKSISVVEYERVKKFGVFINGNSLEDYSITFNVDGNITAPNYSKNDNIYNDKGHLIERNQYNSNHELLYKSIFKYDNNGYLEKEFEYNSNGDLTVEYSYKYNFQKNTIIKLDLDNNNEIQSKTISTYDKNGIISEHYYNNITIYSLNEIFLKSKKFEYNKHGDIYYCISDYYDRHGSGGEFSQKITSVFKYDKKDNWIEQIIYTDGIQTSFQERKIEYY